MTPSDLLNLIRAGGEEAFEHDVIRSTMPSQAKIDLIESLR